MPVLNPVVAANNAGALHLETNQGMTTTNLVPKKFRTAGVACATAATGMGLLYMNAAGAPTIYLVVNALSLLVGLALVAMIPATSPASRISNATVTVLGGLLFATALFGVSVEGVSRWIRVGGLSLQVSLVVLPAMLVAFARGRGPLATTGIVLAAIALALQPDRAMAGVVVAALAVLSICRPDRWVVSTLAVAVVAFVTTLVQPDTLPAVPFAEQILSTSFEVHTLVGLAVLAGALLLVAPAVAGSLIDPENRAVHVVFGTTWLAIVVAAALGNYPTPVVGYGGSAILGYALSLSAMPTKRRSVEVPEETRSGLSLFTEGRERPRALFFRELQDRELDEELRSHLDMKTEANLRKGLDPVEARRQAAIPFGAVERVKKQVPDARSLWLAEDFGRDVKYAVRRLGRAPAFSAAVIATLALGIGGTTAMFSLVNAILLAPLPYPEPDRLVRLGNAMGGVHGATTDLPDAVVLLYQSHARVFDGVAAWRFDDGDLGAMTADQVAVRVRGARVTANFFDVLGVRPALGRGFDPGEDRPGMNNVVMLSHRIWMDRFEGAPDAIGRLIEVNNVPRTVVGVMPPGFAYPSTEVELWLPLSLDPARARPATLNLVGIGRLRRGVSEEAARADLTRVLTRFSDDPTAGSASVMWREAAIPHVQLLRDSIVGPPSRVLWFVFGAVLLVLLVTCTNVAGLLLVRAERAQVEIAARSALGSGFRGILTLMLSEALLLSALGGAIGVLLAAASISAIRGAGSALSLPRLESVAVDTRIMLFALATTLFCALFVSILPIGRMRRVPVAQVLRGASSGVWVPSRQHRGRDVLVVAQIAIAVVLVTISGLLARSLDKLYAVHPGFEADGVVTSRVLLPYTGYGSGEARLNFFEALTRATQAVPGVRSVALTDRVPFSGDGLEVAIEVESRLSLGRAEGVEHPVAHVDGALFETLAIPMLSGRTFGTLNPAQPVDEAIVSRSFAERYWPDEDPLGKRIRPAGGRWSVVVGIVGDVRYDAIEEAARETVYFPLLVVPPQRTDATLPPALSVVVRTDAGAGETLAAIRRIVSGLNPTVPTFNEASLREIVHNASARTRALAVLLAGASAVTLLLSALALHGLLSYVVSIRQREFSIRMALGATPADIGRMMSLAGFRLAAVGIVLGTACALAASQLLRGLLYGVGPMDRATLGATCGVIIVVTLMASWIPARRAAGVHPAESL